MKTANNPFLTTGEAAELCGVTPDTILKWIKRGTLKVARTAGGHHRIEKSALTPYLAVRDRSDDGSGPGGMEACWQLHETRNGIRSKCRKCPVYLKSMGTTTLEHRM